MTKKTFVSKTELLEIANKELRQQSFYRPGDEITEAGMVGPVLALSMPSAQGDFHTLATEYQDFAHSLSLRYEIVG